MFASKLLDKILMHVRAAECVNYATTGTGSTNCVYMIEENIACKDCKKFKSKEK